MKRATKLRPSEGGKMWGPVGPSAMRAVLATTRGDAMGAENEKDPREATRLLRHQPGVDWSDVAQPVAPRDEELDRERARLVGKRCRWVDAPGAREVTVTDARRLPFNGAVVADFTSDASSGSCYPQYLEPIPEEPTKTAADMTADDLARLKRDDPVKFRALITGKQEPTKPLTFGDLPVGAEFRLAYGCVRWRKSAELAAVMPTGERGDRCPFSEEERVERL